MDFRKFVINLESRPDRKSEMQRQLARVGWEAEFVQAVRPDDRGEFSSVGARGCFLSHLKTLKLGLGSNILLMEDDLNFAGGFRDLWPSAIDELPPDWSIFYPAHKDGSGLLDPSTGIMCAHMVAFRAPVVRRIVEGLETILSRPEGHPLGGPMHVDGAYSTIRRQNPDIKTYGAASPLGYQRSSKSDIAAPRIFDRIPALAPAINALRRVKTAFR